MQRLVDCPTDAEAWGRFVEKYGPTIYAWCRRYRIQDAHAQDITQGIFEKLLQSLARFDRSKSRFRTWLHEVVENAVKDWFRISSLAARGECF